MWQVTTEYSNRNKKNEQNAKLLNKYKEKYLNVEKKYVINKNITSIRACSRKELKNSHRSMSNLKACATCLYRLQQSSSMWLKPSGCSSYGVKFFKSFQEHAVIELFFYITYFFSTFRYFSLYLFSNLAFCSFFLFLLLHSVLVTHHSAGSDLYSSINSIKNWYSSAVPLEDIARSILLQITTAGTTTRCQLRVILRFVCASKHSDGASIGCLRKKYQTVLISRKQLAQARKQHPTLSSNLRKHSVCANCLHK